MNKHKQHSERENDFDKKLIDMAKRYTNRVKELKEEIKQLAGIIHDWFQENMRFEIEEIKTLKDQNEFLKDTNRELGRHETKRIKKIHGEQRKKVEDIFKDLKGILFNEHHYKNYIRYEISGAELEELKQKYSDKAFKEEK